MSEPTREQIKEAFNKTIERWERTVEDVKFYEKSDCPLCNLFPKHMCTQTICPIGIYAKRGSCNATPYWKFTEDKTPENALAELNFLRKVYIWWMEKEVNNILEKYGIDDLKEEKKEKWVDITKQIDWSVRADFEGKFCVFLMMDKDGLFGHMLANGDFFFARGEYKVEHKLNDQYFRILKKI